MNNPELYGKSNILQKKDIRQCLEDYGKVFKWNKYGTTVIDIGCGDGSVTTDILKPFLPNSCKELVGCDINEKMVQFANDHHAREFISFTVLDIEGDLPEQLREKFDHAFSFYTLHWIKHQEITFSNIYDLLVSGGDCLLMFLGHMPVYEVWRELARAPRWNYLLKDVDRYVSPYHDCQNPENDIKIMMSTIGFTNLEVKCQHKEFIFNGREAFKNAMISVIPFKIPLEMEEVFLEDYLKVVRDMQLADHTYNNNEDGKSTTDAGATLLEHIYDAWEKSQNAIGVFYDLSKAFDCVDHETLLCKLKHYGVYGRKSLCNNYIVIKIP